MSKHTPGPWSVSKSSYRRVYMPDDNIEICPGYSQTPICTMYRVNFDMDGIKDRANAHLIAAAPDMYEVLERTLAHLNGEDDADDMAELGERIEDALAKARGEK